MAVWEEWEDLEIELRERHPDLTDEMIEEMLWARLMPAEAAEVRNG